MDRPVLDLVAQAFLLKNGALGIVKLKMVDWRYRYFCKILNCFQVSKINYRSVVFLCTY